MEHARPAWRAGLESGADDDDGRPVRAPHRRHGLDLGARPRPRGAQLLDGQHAVHTPGESHFEILSLSLFFFLLFSHATKGRKVFAYPQYYNIRGDKE